MKQKVELTQQVYNKIVTNYNSMLSTLQRIAKEYETTTELEKSCWDNWWCEYTEAVELAYENIQEEAKQVIKWVKSI